MALTKILQEGIKDGEIINADINANAAIATSKISGLATSATTDTTNASNIGSGTLPDGRFPATLPAASAANLTAIPAANITGTLPAISGANLTGINTDLVADTSPQLGGTLASNGNKIHMADNDHIYAGTGQDLHIWHDGTNSYITSNNGYLQINAAYNEIGAKLIPNGAVELYYDNSKKLETFANGCKLYSNSGSARLEIQGGEGSGAWLQIQADDGDDNADYWRMYVGTNADFYLQNYKDGAWETNLDATGGGNIRLMYDNSLRLETLSEGINVKGTSSTTAQIKIHSQPAIGRSYWGYGGNQTYTGTSIGRTDSSTASSIFMGVDVTGNAGGNFGGLGSEIVFRRDHIFTTPNAANNNFVTCMRFGRATSTEGAVAFTNGLMFGNDQADANILDDYEEGSGTVSVYSNPNVVINSTYNQADYTKVGNMVTVTMLLQINSVSSTNYFRINMPFTNVNHGNPRRSDAIGVVMHNGVNTGDAGVVGYLPMGSSVISFYKVSDNTSWSILTNSDLATNDEMYLTITYKTA